MSMRINRILFSVIALATFMPAGAIAQQRPLLDQADGAISNGTFADARALLDEWRRRNPRAEDEDKARYHVLAARLTLNADSAEDSYLTVAVNYPTTRVAPEALLRLAQARQARADTTQAASYLERLIADYPNAEQLPMAGVWLARLTRNSRNNASLCRRLRGIAPGTNPETLNLLKTEMERVCGTPITLTPSRNPVGRPVRTDTSRVAPTTPAAPATPSDATGKIAIQVGAFREVGGAREVKAQIERAGITNVRLVRVPGNQLIRVRVGRFANRAAAASTLARLANADISAVLVSDADSETVVKD
jgi:cell division septation protein DedD